MILVVMGLGLRQPVKVLAGDEACPAEYPYCYDYTIVNQWACETCPSDNLEYACSNNTDISCGTEEPDQEICNQYDAGYCYQVCRLDDGTVWQGSCKVLQLNVQCDTSEGYCRWQGDLTNCL